MKIKNLIIGAGISGLSFAYFSDDYLIVEKESEIGGFCRTIYSNDFVWDYAGHFFHFKDENIKEMFLSKVKKEDIIYKEKCTKIFFKNKLIDYPFQTNIHQLDKDDFIDCLYDLFNKVEKEEYDNFLDMLYGKFGKSIVNFFLKPYNEKLYACDLKKLDKDAMGRFFPYADKQQIINNMRKNVSTSYNDVFLYPKNGAASFMNILFNELDKSKVLLNTTIKEIDVENKFAYTSTGLTIEYENIINTSPLNEFVSILKFKNSLINQDIFSYNQVLVFNLGFNKGSKFTQEHWIYFPEKEINFYRAGFYNNILNQEKLSMYIEIGYSKDFNITEQEIKSQLDKTLESLTKVGIIDKTFVLENYCTIIMNPAYVHISKESNDATHKLFENLKAKNIYSIGRYGSWTYCSMEDSILQAKELANSIK